MGGQWEGYETSVEVRWGSRMGRCFHRRTWLAAMSRQGGLMEMELQRIVAVVAADSQQVRSIVACVC